MANNSIIIGAVYHFQGRRVKVLSIQRALYGRKAQVTIADFVTGEQRSTWCVIFREEACRMA